MTKVNVKNIVLKPAIYQNAFIRIFVLGNISEINVKYVIFVGLIFFLSLNSFEIYLIIIIIIISFLIFHNFKICLNFSLFNS